MSRITRSQVPVEETWNLADIFESDEAWEAERAAVEAELPALLEHRGALGVSPAHLLACLDAYEAMTGRLNRVLQYAHYRYTEDTTNPTSQAMAGRANMLYGQVRNVLTDLRAAMLRLPEGMVERFMSEEPALQGYRRFLELLIASQAHALTPEAEAALSAVSPGLTAPMSVFSAITSSDMKFEPVTDSQGREVPISLFFYMTQIETSPDTTLRRRAYESLVKGLTPYQNGLGTNLSTHIRNNVALARLRGYSSTAEMILQHSGDGRNPDQVPVPVYEMVLDEIQRGIAPHMQRYARLRKRVLGLDKLLFSDVKAPLDPEFDPRVTWEEAADMLCGAVEVLGPEYAAAMRRAFTDRWVYRANNAGCGMIAFGGGVYGVHGYSFYPWGGNLFDAFLLGHELGHSVHYDFAMRHQKALDLAAPLFFVEAPSTLTEHLMVQHVRQTNSDPRLRRWLNMYLMMSYHHNFVTHMLEAELLRRLYTMAEAGKPLTTTVLNNTKFEILASFWGDTVELDEGAKLTWMRQPHYYHGLYPYTYSVGLTASTVLAQRIAREGRAAGERWVDVLKMGGSRSALDLFAAAGLDMTRPEPYREAAAFVGRIVDELEESFA
ncbi:MAG: M3 family metallopeptidase [Bacillota bacterium]